MIVRNIDEIRGTPRDVDTPNWNSRRLLLKKDGMGFSMHDTIIRAGTATKICYRNHLEAVYCIEGEGSLEDLGTGKVYSILPGTMYALDQHEPHVLKGLTDMRVICVFNPPVTGEEVHDEGGAYPVSIDDAGA